MKILITGPCGSGKTAIIEELDKLSYKTSIELEKQFWFDENKVEDFEKGIMDNRIKIYEGLNNEELVFFDRGVLDVLVYRKYEGKTIPEAFDKIAKKYRYDLVFVTAPLDKQEPNPERNHLIKTKEDAIKWFKLMLETLEEYGYKPMIIESKSIKDRIKFILGNIKS